MTLQEYEDVELIQDTPERMIVRILIRKEIEKFLSLSEASESDAKALFYLLNSHFYAYLQRSAICDIWYWYIGSEKERARAIVALEKIKLGSNPTEAIKYANTNGQSAKSTGRLRPKP